MAIYSSFKTTDYYGEADDFIRIKVDNRINGNIEDVEVFLDNCLGELAEMYDINLTETPVSFVNPRTNEETDNPNMTVQDFDLKEGDILTLDSRKNGINKIMISVVRQGSGLMIDSRVFSVDTTLGNVAEQLKDELGIHKSNLQYTNKRTMRMTSDSSMSLAEFGLQTNDVLAINDDGSVA